MATIKSYTDLEQSKMLTKILPIETADMEFMFLKKDGSKVSNVPFVKDGFEEPECCYIFIPSWSLTTLLYVLNFPSLTQEKENEWEVCVFDHDNDKYIEVTASNPVDACYEMILKLHELNLL